MQEKIFYFPEPKKQSSRIVPVFLPFHGCPGKCIYCAQDLQTGSKPESLKKHFLQLSQDLFLMQKEKKEPFELAFFGGTFTGLPRDWQLQFLELAKQYKEQGQITQIRCSTRPDRIEAKQLEELKQAGLDLVELGIQSFSGQVLINAKRGYSPDQAENACSLVKNQGLKLGIQLLPGLPGHNKVEWKTDIRLTVKNLPNLVRIYPCLVLKNTPLAQIYLKDNFQPWSLEQTVSQVAKGVLRLWKNQIPVIRLGLPPEKSMLKSVLDGPWHPALGSLIRSRILLKLISAQSLIMGPGSKKLYLPLKYVSVLNGDKGKNKARLNRTIHAIKTITYHNENYFLLQKQA